MNNLGNQFQHKFNKAFNSRRKRIADIAGNRIRSQMFNNVDQGVDFNNEKFKKYSDYTKKERKKLGYQIAYVDFQRHVKNIKKALVGFRNNASEIFWKPVHSGKYTFGQIFYFHQHGKGNNPERNIFPKLTTDIDTSIHNDIRSKIGEVLDERVD